LGKGGVVVKEKKNKIGVQHEHVPIRYLSDLGQESLEEIPACRRQALLCYRCKIGTSLDTNEKYGT